MTAELFLAVALPSPGKYVLISDQDTVKGNGKCFAEETKGERERDWRVHAHSVCIYTSANWMGVTRDAYYKCEYEM